jgi:hypothetical protein
LSTASLASLVFLAVFGICLIGVITSRAHTGEIVLNPYLHALKYSPYWVFVGSDTHCGSRRTTVLCGKKCAVRGGQIAPGSFLKKPRCFPFTTTESTEIRVRALVYLSEVG